MAFKFANVRKRGIQVGNGEVMAFKFAKVRKRGIQVAMVRKRGIKVRKGKITRHLSLQRLGNTTFKFAKVR